MSKVSQFPAPDKGTAPLPAPEQKVQKETILEYLKVFGYDVILSEAEAQQFIHTALSGNLDPFKREIYLAVYGEGESRKVTILTGYQVYLKRAERTGKLDGWHAWVDGEGESMKAVVEIFRKDWSNSFTHEAYWTEAVQKKRDGKPSSFWSKQPKFQLKKVAIAQAFRLAFPDELGGLPYETSELPDNDTAAPDSPAPLVPNNPDGDVKTSNPDPVADLAGQALENDGDVPEWVKPQRPKVPATAPHQQSADPAEESRENIVKKIEALFEDNPDDFTGKHKNWILDKVSKSPDIAGVQKMLAYTEKVIRTGMSA
jgi:phage recombination protein Bet